MKDYSKQTEWNRINRTVVTIKFHNKNDADVIAYLKDKNKRLTVLAALRYMMAHESDVLAYSEGVNE